MKNSRPSPGALLLLALISVVAAPAASSAATSPEAARLQQDRLARYAFVRTAYDPAALGLLLGNAELGGLANVAGLGIPKLWAADVWKDAQARESIDGPVMVCDEFGPERQPAAYRQTLSLADGVLTTTVGYESGCGYATELFCSMAEQHCVVLRLKNLGGDQARTWKLRWPAGAFTLTKFAPETVAGQSPTNAFTRIAWAARTSQPLSALPDGQSTLHLAPGASVTLVFALTTQWDGADYVQRCATAATGGGPGFDGLRAAHAEAWQALWQQTAVLAVPDAALERLWYRSLFWTISTCGSRRFLPGESMFVVDCWRMHPFTYGAAGWAVQALTAVGLPERAQAMLDWHAQPEALKSNARYFMDKLAITNQSPDALAFAHEVAMDGLNIPAAPWEMQRHLDGFGASLFYRFNRFYPDARYAATTVYPLLRGMAEFWRSLAQPAAPSAGYLLPKLTSVTEDLIATHPIDAALAAQWCLLIAHRSAVALDKDRALRNQWRDLAGRLCIPRNEQRYLEYFGDQEQRAGGGYQGVRGFVYLGYPTLELIPLLDRERAIRTLDYTWTRNRQGEGMIGFVANWFALADTHYGRGEHALAIMQHDLKCLDRWDTSLSETPGNGNYYFTTNYASYLLVLLSMAVQSCDDRIAVFPAVPASWKDFTFYNVPAEAGIRVSAAMKDCQVQWVSYSKDGQELLRLTRKAQVTIRHDGSRVTVTTE